MNLLGPVLRRQSRDVAVVVEARLLPIMNGLRPLVIVVRIDNLWQRFLPTMNLADERRFAQLLTLSEAAAIVGRLVVLGEICDVVVVLLIEEAVPLVAGIASFLLVSAFLFPGYFWILMLCHRREALRHALVAGADRQVSSGYRSEGGNTLARVGSTRLGRGPITVLSLRK